MEYKRTLPALGGNAEQDTQLVLGYVEDIKAETEARITFLENTIDVIKESLRSLTEVSQ